MIIVGTGQDTPERELLQKAALHINLRRAGRSACARSVFCRSPSARFHVMTNNETSARAVKRLSALGKHRGNRISLHRVR